MKASAKSWIDKLRCPQCFGQKLKALPKRKGNWGAWGVPGLKCPDCGAGYPVIEPGILRLLPPGDYARYEYWEKLQSHTDIGSMAEALHRRLTCPDGFLLPFYVMPRLAKQLGWRAQSAIEVGSQWGSNMLAMHRFGLAKEHWLLDISPVALKGALALFKTFGLEPFAVQGEIHALPFRDRAFDLSFSGGLYEHFVGAEQRQLVAENVRISRKVLCQVPVNSSAYWVYRGILTLMNGGKWPFGFERPLSAARLERLYTEGGARVVARDWHNLVTALIVVAGEKRPWIQRMAQGRPGIFWIFRHDAVIAAETGGKHGSKG